MQVDDKLAKEKLARILDDYAEKQNMAWVQPRQSIQICAQLIRNTDLTDCQQEVGEYERGYREAMARKGKSLLIAPAPDQGSVRTDVARECAQIARTLTIEDGYGGKVRASGNWIADEIEHRFLRALPDQKD